MIEVHMMECGPRAELSSPDSILVALPSNRSANEQIDDCLD